MELVVKEMAQVTVPKDLLKKIDMPSLLKDFKNDYGKLDDLGRARKKHESRGAISRWWNSDEIEEAQLDAAELQASFSKKLGQLMVISIQQSKILTEQQDNLLKQQNRIKQQANELSLANSQLDTQQKQQKQQQQKLEKLIKDYFELKGLTAKDAEKLIQIANDVKKMKKTIFDKLDLEVLSMNKIKDSLFKKFEKEVHLFNAKLDKFEVELQSTLNQISNEFGEKFAAAQKSLDTSLQKLNTTVTENYESLSQDNELTNLKISNIEKESQKKYVDLNDELATQQRILEQSNSSIVTLEDNLHSQEQKFERELNTQQSEIEETKSTIASVETDTENKYQQLENALLTHKSELKTKIEQLDSQYKQELVLQEKRILSEQKQYEVALTQSNKKIKHLTVGLIVSFLIGASSLAVVIYPYLNV